MKYILTFHLFFIFTTLRSQVVPDPRISDSVRNLQPKVVQDAIDKMHYFSTTEDEYNYIVSTKGLLRYVKGLEKIKTNYTLESIGIDGYTKERNINLSYLMRWEGNKIFPCAFVVAFLEKGKIVTLKCIPIDNLDEALSTKMKNEFKKVGPHWMQSLIQLLLSLSSEYAIKTNFY